MSPRFLYLALFSQLLNAAFWNVKMYGCKFDWSLSCMLMTINFDFQVFVCTHLTEIFHESLLLKVSYQIFESSSITLIINFLLLYSIIKKFERNAV